MTRGLAPALACVAPPPRGTGTIAWKVPPPDGSYTLTGEVYVDGSTRNARRSVLASSGAGFAQVDGQQVVAAGFVTFAGPQTTRAAELHAVVAALRLCLPPMRIHTDHLGVIKGLRRGERWCTAAKRPHPRIWREIWRRIRDIGEGDEGVTFVKVKAHITREDVTLGRHPAADKIGNDAADEMAKAASASVAPARAKVLLHEAAAARYAEVLK